MDHYFHKKLLLIISLLFLVSISTIATESPTSSPSAAPESSPPNLKSESPNLQPESSSSSSASPNLQPESSSSSSASPNLQPESSSSGSPSQSPAFPPSSHVSFPPSGSDAPSPSMSSSSELDSPDSPDANRNTEPEDSPDSYVPEEETPEGPDGEIPSSVPSSSSKSESESESDSDSSDPPLKEEITDKNANPEVKKACGSTDYPNLCINTLDPIISPKKELLMSSGIVLNDNVYWVTFHSGYDFGYLLKLLTCQNLPDTQSGFFELINIYFPVIYDIKHLMKFCNSLHGGLNKLAELLDVERVGVCHQAGSDSLLTACTFRKLKENFFSGSLEKYAGVLYGLGVEGGQNMH